MNAFHFSGRASSGKIASTGHSGSQAPQSMHSSGSMTSSRPNSWMQSTGQTSTQDRSLMSMHGSAMMYVTESYSTEASSSSISTGARSTSADLATTWSKPAACAARNPPVSVWLVKPAVVMSGYASATSFGSLRQV